MHREVGAGCVFDVAADAPNGKLRREECGFWNHRPGFKSCPAPFFYLCALGKFFFFLTYLIKEECRLPTHARVMKQSHVPGLLRLPGAHPPQYHYPCRGLCVTEELLDFPRASSTRKSRSARGPSSSPAALPEPRETLPSWPGQSGWENSNLGPELSQRWAPRALGFHAEVWGCNHGLDLWKSTRFPATT